MYRISKEFSCAYGHRVWTQKLDRPDLSVDTACVCRHLHGHEAKVVVYLEAQELTNSMVTDFRNLGWLKQWLDTYVDHHFIIDRNDPLFSRLTGVTSEAQLRPVVLANFRGVVVVADRVCVDDIPENSPEHELFSGFLVVDFVPTSENLAKWIHEIVEIKMSGLGVSVPQVDWWETPKSKSSYYRE